ncbi:MAG: class I tRNA ligase family protein, partial [Candidatus Aenigmatarchaeota archaeon]
FGKQYKVIRKFPGKDIVGMKYEPLLDIPLQKNLEHKVVASIPIMKVRVAGKIATKKHITQEDEFGHIVTMDVGSGIVHIAPGHGDSDNRLGRHYGLSEPSPVNERGEMTEETGKFAGLFVKDANNEIIEELKKNNMMFFSGKIVHSYPLCWRCKTQLIYRMSRQWFLKTDIIRESMLTENKNVNWLPKFASERFENLLNDAPDWAVTRQRYWGIPLPVWVCKDCNKTIVIGSKDELNKLSGTKDFSLNKSDVDKIHLPCSCGKTMKRDPDIMDVWFDSSISPWASLGYPFRNKELFEKLWEVDLIDESQDQIRGWFYYLLFSSVSTFGKKPYKTVCLNGWVLDEQGEKMSKSLGNVVFAKDALTELGADSLRLYYCHDVAPWETQKFSMKNAKELGKTFNILLNVFNYYKTYCKKETNAGNLCDEDKWLLSRLNSLIKSVTENMENFYFHNAGRDITSFILNDFSRTYIKIIRGRYDNALDYTMTKCLNVLCRLLAPIAPLVSEYVYYDIFSKSVHFQPWPTPDERLISKEIEMQMIVAESIVETSNQTRKEKNIKLRWPLGSLVINGSKEITDAALKLQEIIKKLCNVKSVSIDIIGDKETIKFNVKELEISGDIFLDTIIDDDLKNEALMHELTRKIQETRKQLGLSVSDRIMLHIDNEKMLSFEKQIKSAVGASEMVIQEIKNETGKVELDDETIKFRFTKVSK